MDSKPRLRIPKPSGVFAEPWSLGKIVRMLAAFGPAAIVASVAIGAGETIIVVQAGSWAGYELLWLVLLAVLVKGVCVTYLLGRYAAVTGEAVGRRLVEFPGPRGWLLLAIVVMELVAAGPLWAAIARPCGNLLYYLLRKPGESQQTWLAPDVWTALLASAFVVLVLAMSLRQTYKRLERQQVLICCLLVAGTMVGTWWVRPDLNAALGGLFNIGHLPRDMPPWAPVVAQTQPLLTMATTFGYIGGTVMGYLAYANWVKLSGWGVCTHDNLQVVRPPDWHPSTGLPTDADAPHRLRKLLATLRWDVGMGAAVMLIVAASFMMSGAAVLYPLLAEGRIDGAFTGWSLLTDQAHIWRNIHPLLVWVYYVCIVAALWGTLHAFPEIYSRVTHEFCTAIWPERTWNFAWLQRVICAYVLCVTLLFVWLPVDFATLTAIVAFLSTNAAVALAMIAALWLNFQLPPAYRVRSWMLAASIFSAAVLVCVTLLSAWGLWQRLVGI